MTSLHLRLRNIVTSTLWLLAITVWVSCDEGNDFQPVNLDIAFTGNRAIANVHSHDKVVVCYVGTWAVYRPAGGAYDLLEQFDPNLCTHLIYSFAGLNNATFDMKPLDAYLDLEEEYGKGWFKKVNGIKLKHPHLRVLLAIGGWNEGSEKYSIMAEDPIKREHFSQSALALVRKYGFDGLDLDWEFPGRRGGKPEDKQNFVTLVEELRVKFNKFGLLLTAAFGSSKEIADDAYDLRELSRLLDHIHIMCYDYHGSWDARTYHNAPLFAPEGNLSVASSVEYYLSQGVDPSKLVLGLPLYGRTFLINEDAPGSGLTKSAEKQGFQGPYTRENGFLGYNEICKELNGNRGQWKTYWDPSAKVPFMRSGSKWLSFDNPESLYQKVEFALSKRLRGAMVWSIDTDDFLGYCGGTKYPLMQSINYALAIEESKTKKPPAKVPEKKKKPGSSSAGGSNIKFSTWSTNFLILIAAYGIKFAMF